MPVARMGDEKPLDPGDIRLNHIPVIDIFAGPGGLGEGFSSLKNKGIPRFKIHLSVENDVSAHKTLELRSFFRHFPKNRVPKEYYKYLKNKLTRKELFEKYPEIAEAASREALCATLGKPDDDKVILERIDTILKNQPQRKHWVLIGGPPCQAYSVAGRARMSGFDEFEKDHRHTLYKVYLSIISRFKPSVFVMENVRGILSSKLEGEFIFPKIIRDLKHPSNQLEYSIASLVSNADEDSSKNGNSEESENYLIKSEEYGIPQRRHRIILVGIRKDLIPGSGDFRVPKLKKHGRIVSVKDVIGDLPPLRSGLSRVEDSKSNWKQEIEKMIESGWVYTSKINKDDKDLTSYITSIVESIHAPNTDRGGRYVERNGHKPAAHKNWYYDTRLKGIVNHETREHLESDLHRYMFTSAYGRKYKVSPKLRDFPKWLLPNHKNVAKASNGYGFFNDRFRVQLMDDPSTTITSHIAKDGHSYIHYDPHQCRSFTVREAARMQTFPDNYFFEGNRTEQYHQVGNAVPPLLAKQVAKIIYQVLKQLM